MASLFADDGPILRDGGEVGRLDGFDTGDATVAHVGSTGIAAVEPLVTVTHGGRIGVYARCSADRLDRVVAACLDGPDPTAADPDAVVESDGTTDLPVAALGERAAGVRTVLGACGWLRPTEPDDHADAGGFPDPSPDAVLALGETLRGRGWGDWCRDASLAETWRTARDADGDAVVVVNAHGPTDALLARSAPFELLDGAAALARAIDAESAVVYLDESDGVARQRVRDAADAYPAPPVAMTVAAGPSVYRAAEPTMAIEAIEGADRLEARLRPPGPETVGLDGRPTVVHTGRTLAHLARAVRDGATTESRVVRVTGDVDAPAIVELAADATLADALDAVDVEGSLKAACVGGRFGGLTGSLDVAPSADARSEAGLGTDADIDVVAEGRCLVEFVGKRASVAADTNCGRCVPCREGTTQLAELLRDIYDGSYDPDAITELVGVMNDTSICAFGVDAGRPARTAIDAFDAEFSAHADGDCPAGACFEPMEHTT